MAGESRKRKVGLLYDERMCKHDTPDGEDHPECPNRIKAIWAKLQLTGLAQRCVVLGGSKAEDKHLQLVHTKEHVNLVKSLSTKKKDSRRNKIASKLDSKYLNGGSSEAAYLAAGSVVEVAEKVAEGELDCGFAIVRPPGHHAEADEAMGFCLFNNVAVAASYLLNQRPDLGIKKILIVDWDVHHGNGTQKMFWKDPRVLVFSVHRHDGGSFYPTGDDGDYDKVGEGAGEGFNINVPWEQGRRCGDEDYIAVWDHILIPVTKEFNPDLILLSAGFDAAIGDPRGRCFVTPYGYSVMLKKLMEFAQGKIVMALEGGYNLGSVAKSSLACVQVLLEEKQIQDSFEEYPYESTCRVIEAVRKRLCAYWPSLADELPWEAKTPSSPTSSSSSDDGEEVLESTFIQERCIREAKLTILSIRYKKASRELACFLGGGLGRKGGATDQGG
ncbi:histone deacetylase 5-like isoform X2 [Brassica rapa]|uniref:histone deacetylase 5-like isoform X2 n=1 Tax=Brassica campestris TaxID=3711 RepID=UPI00142DA101|nr:histone deacetylase 5-like isoform X2 [Brassica rapa]